MAIENQAFTIDVDDFGLTGIIGVTKIGGPVGTFDPEPSAVEDDAMTGTREVIELSSGATFSEMYMGQDETGSPVFDFDSIKQIRLVGPAPSTDLFLLINFDDTGIGGDLEESSSSAGFYYFFPDLHDFFAGEQGSVFTMTFEGSDPPPPAMDTIIKNPKNPGGGVPIPEAEYTTDQTGQVTQSAAQQPGNASGGGNGKGGGGGPPAEVIINLPPQAGAFDLTAHIEGYDFGSQTWYPILVGANITGGGTNQRLKVSSTSADVANASANDILPYMWRVRIVHGDATAVTYSVEYKL